MSQGSSFQGGFPAQGQGQGQLRTNAAAIVSLVLGILGCVPLVTGVLAVVFGIFGLRKSRDPLAGGKGMAIAGLVLGLVSIVLWLAVLIPVGMTWMNARPQQQLARQFITDLAERKVDAADAMTASTLGRANLVKWSERMNEMGELKGIRFRGFNYTLVNKTQQWVLTGDANFSKESLPFTLTTIWQEGQWRVYRLHLPPKMTYGPTTTPSF